MRYPDLNIRHAHRFKSNMFCVQDERELEQTRRELKKTDADYLEWATRFEELRQSVKQVFSKSDSKTWANFVKHYLSLIHI